MTSIVCLGDSITNGIINTVAADGSTVSTVTPKGGYRGHLIDGLAATSYPVTAIGSLVGPAQYGGHEGHNGWTISDATRALPSIVTTFLPDIVLILLGTNDVIGGLSTPTTRADAPVKLGVLLDVLAASWPLAQLVVSTIPPTLLTSPAGANQLVSEYNAQLASVCLGRARLATPKIPATSLYLTDGVHPSDLGYQEIAKAFYPVVCSLVDVGSLIRVSITVRLGGADYCAESVNLRRVS